MHEASFYRTLPSDTGQSPAVVCELCPHHCRIRPGGRGICLTRTNENGILYSTSYCRPVSAAVDPIEKKPLFHFFPGSYIYSTGPNGCNFKCRFCQNHEISQELLPTAVQSARQIVDAVLQSGTIGMAYTYSEPSIWYETVMDVGAQIKKHGLVNVMVTNGYIEKTPLLDLLEIVDAMNIDIKSMDPKFYTRLCKATLAPVLSNCETVKKAGCHLEITNLLIPGENDAPGNIRDLAIFIATVLGRDTPLHISRYFPRYRMNHAATPAQSLELAYQIAREHLDHVYLGNMGTLNREQTLCPSCGAALVTRLGYHVEIAASMFKHPDMSLDRVSCARCDHSLYFRIK